jgi:hypothetical protein
MTNHIAIGAISDMDTKPKMINLDRIWSKYLKDGKRHCDLRVHGLGVGSLRLMLRYAWSSVDTASWVKHAENGIVLVPKTKNGRYVYNERPHKIAISERSLAQKKIGRHFHTLYEVEKVLLREYFKIKGYTIGEFHYRAEKSQPDDAAKVKCLSNDFQQRAEINMLFYLDLEKAITQ